MSFDIFLIPSSATPDGDGTLAAAGRALSLCGARWGGREEADIILSTGEEVEFYGPTEENTGGMFSLRGGLSIELAQVIFEVADATQCFIIAPSSPPHLMRTPGNVGAWDGDPPEDGGEAIVDIADARALAEQLGTGVSTWIDYAAQVTGGSGQASTEVEDDPIVDPNLLDRFFKRSPDGS